MSCNDVLLNSITIDDFKAYFPSIEYNPYSQWDALIDYNVDIYIYYNFKVYKSLQTPNLNQNPAISSTYWEYQSNIDMSVYMFDSYITDSFELACCSLAWFFNTTCDPIKKEAFLLLTAHNAELRRMNTSPVQNIDYGFDSSTSVGSVSTSKTIPTWLTDKEYYGFIKTIYGSRYIDMMARHRKPFVASFAGYTNF